MTPEESKAQQQTLWWITSIATSVVCCSVLFILFASYLVEIKNDLRDNDLRINNVEEREDRILAEIEMMRTHGLTPPAISGAAAPAAPTPSTPTTPPNPAAGPAPGGNGASVTVPVTPPAPNTIAPTAPAATASPAPAMPAPAAK